MYYSIRDLFIKKLEYWFTDIWCVNFSCNLNNCTWYCTNRQLRYYCAPDYGAEAGQTMWIDKEHRPQNMKMTKRVRHRSHAAVDRCDDRHLGDNDPSLPVLLSTSRVLVLEICLLLIHLYSFIFQIIRLVNGTTYISKVVPFYVVEHDLRVWRVDILLYQRSFPCMLNTRRFIRYM